MSADLLGADARRTARMLVARFLFAPETMDAEALAQLVMAMALLEIEREAPGGPADADLVARDPWAALALDWCAAGGDAEQTWDRLALLRDNGEGDGDGNVGC